MLARARCTSTDSPPWGKAMAAARPTTATIIKVFRVATRIFPRARDVAPADKEMIEFMVITFRLSLEISRSMPTLQNWNGGDGIAHSNQWQHPVATACVKTRFTPRQRRAVQ